MASTSNYRAPSYGTSSSSQSAILTPPSSSDGASHASTAGSGCTTTSDEPRQPSHQELAYAAQPATDDGSMCARLANQPQTGDLLGRLVHYEAQAQQTIALFETKFQTPQP